MYQQEIPGIPVVVWINCPTSKIQYVDYHLQLIVTKIPSCFKKTKNNQKIGNLKEVSQDTIVTMDAKFPYTNIPDLEDISAV